MLIALKDQPTKMYQFDGVRFSETPIHFSGGSFGRGVMNMRVFYQAAVPLIGKQDTHTQPHTNSHIPNNKNKIINFVFFGNKF